MDVHGTVPSDGDLVCYCHETCAAQNGIPLHTGFSGKFLRFVITRKNYVITKPAGGVFPARIS
jgi:hypothetical protein